MTAAPRPREAGVCAAPADHLPCAVYTLRAHHARVAAPRRINVERMRRYADRKAPPTQPPPEPKRTAYILAHFGFDDIRDLRGVCFNCLAEVRYVGPTTVEAIEAILDFYGYRLSTPAGCCRCSPEARRAQMRDRFRLITDSVDHSLASER